MTTKSVSTAYLMPLMRDLLNDQSVKFTNTGNSMRPFIREGIDQVEVEKRKFEHIKVYDIVLCERYPDNYAMHRVIKKTENAVFIVGDAQYTIEGPIQAEKILAVVTSIYRDGKRVSCDHKGYKVLVWFWMKLRRVRVRLIRLMYPDASKS